MRTLLSFALVVFLTFNVYAQRTGLGNTDPAVFTKFTLPFTEYRRFYLSGGTSVNLNRDASSSMETTDHSSKSFSFNAAPSYYYNKESDDQSFSFNSYLSTNINYNSSEGGLSSSSSAGRSGYVSLSLGVVNRDYFSGNQDYFYNTNLNGSLQMSEQKNENNNGGVTLISWRGNKYQSYSARFGLGWGRLRDVTPVVNAIRFQERLKVLNKINADLPADAILGIGQQFSRSGKYNVYERSAKYFWADMDNILSKNNIGLNDLNLYSAAYLQEVFSELRFQRLEGFYSGFDLTLDYYNSYNLNEAQPEPRLTSINESLFLRPFIYANYSHQLDLYSQFRLDLTATGGPNLIKNYLVKQQYDFSLTPSFDRELTDRFVFSASDQLVYSIRNSDLREKNLTNYLRASFSYYIENNLDLYLNYEWSHTEQYITEETLAQFLSNGQSHIHSAHNLNVGVTYYLQKGLTLR